VLQQAYAASPGRFSRPPAPPPPPARVWINQPPATIETEATPHKNQTTWCLIAFDRLRYEGCRCRARRQVKCESDLFDGRARARRTNVLRDRLCNGRIHNDL